MDINSAFQLALSVLPPISLSVLPSMIDLIKENSAPYQAHCLKVQERAKQLAEESSKNIDNIPNQYKIENPKSSILLPTIQTSLLYLEENEIRKMFSKLIAASFDSRKANVLHPGFISMISQLSPNDARILNKINNSDNILGICCIKDNMEYPIIECELVKELTIEQFALSMINLKRLEILTFNSHLLNSNNVYISTALSRQKINGSLLEYINSQGYEAYTNDVYFTKLGESFLKVCID